MSLKNASVLTGATMAPSGGTALVFESLGIRNNSNIIIATADEDLRTRRSMLCTVKEPKISSGAPNGYTQGRATLIFKSPLELDNGNITVNTIRIETAYDVETSAAELTELKVIACQVLADTDFDAFFSSLSLE